MDLKFSFSGSSNPSHSHDDHAAGGRALPFAGASSTAPGSGSSVLELRVSREGGELVCEGCSGDGVSYARATVSLDDRPLATALRSVLARAGAELPEPLLGSVTAVVIDLDGGEIEALEALGMTVATASVQLATVDEALQARTGITAGTPISRATP